jgi:hypothetical protein
MFTHANAEHSVVTRSSPFALPKRGTHWALWCCSIGLAVAIAGALVFVVWQIAFGREPIGGVSGLVVLYLATAFAGIGLAVLARIAPIAWRTFGSATATSFSTEGSMPEEIRKDAQEAA